MYRVGFGYDVHKIESTVNNEQSHIPLCGVFIPCEYKVIAHSDGDIALHALVDALLGAACIEDAYDIGTLFPNTDQLWKGKTSSYFVEHTLSLLVNEGYTVNNVDITIVCETPKIQQYKDEMRQKVSELLHITKNRVSVKATTTEKLGFEGRKEGISAYVVVSLSEIAPKKAS